MPIIGNRRTSYNILLYSSKSIFKEAKEYIYYLYHVDTSMGPSTKYGYLLPKYLILCFMHVRDKFALTSHPL